MSLEEYGSEGMCIIIDTKKKSEYLVSNGENIVSEWGNVSLRDTPHPLTHSNGELVNCSLIMIDEVKTLVEN